MQQQALEPADVAEEGRSRVDNLTTARAEAHGRVEAHEVERRTLGLDKVERSLLSQSLAVGCEGKLPQLGRNARYRDDRLTCSAASSAVISSQESSRHAGPTFEPEPM